MDFHIKIIFLISISWSISWSALCIAWWLRWVSVCNSIDITMGTMGKLVSCSQLFQNLSLQIFICGAHIMSFVALSATLHDILVCDVVDYSIFIDVCLLVFFIVIFLTNRCNTNLIVLVLNGVDSDLGIFVS